LQFAHQRMVWRLARFDLAAGKFPIAGPDFAGGALGEKKGVIWPLKNGGGDFDDFCFFGLAVQLNLLNLLLASSLPETIDDKAVRVEPADGRHVAATPLRGLSKHEWPENNTARAHHTHASLVKPKNRS